MNWRTALTDVDGSPAFRAKFQHEQCKLFLLVVAHGVEADAEALRIVGSLGYAADLKAQAVGLETHFYLIVKLAGKRSFDLNGTASKAQVDEKARKIESILWRPQDHWPFAFLLDV
jgi:hypothetical protein